MTRLGDTPQLASARAARATWAAGDWDGLSRHLAPVGALVLERSAVRAGMTLLDVGTGTGANIAIPAAERAATVVGADITPELLAQARQRFRPSRGWGGLDRGRRAGSPVSGR